ncbi:hypothetical protein Ddye_001435 [Dipteronia dyeriana]|uniref:Transposase MuDR plant domain-containing protein n=1 Tax=Dipteronia dyeriana TaxID=168575 RepID=A0AAE0CTI0_9ROSI|nr:hypothetical protein Ddye_001435 [Dipteronia dyeriana]
MVYKVKSDGDEGNNGVGVGVDVNEGLFAEVNVGVDGVQTGEGVNTGEDVHNKVRIDGDHIDGDDEITNQCQTFDSKEEIRDIFRKYAIRECVTLGRIKNDLLRQTYVCKSDGCPWRAHGCRTIKKKSFIIKTLDDNHDCHRVYNNSVAKVKRITSRVEPLVKSNPIVSAKLLCDLLLERVNARILKNDQASRQLTIILAEDQEYELLSPDEMFAVKLKEYHCGCGS